MSRSLFLVQNCHGRFFDVTGIFAKIVTGKKKDVTGKKNTGAVCKIKMGASVVDFYKRGKNGSKDFSLC